MMILLYKISDGFYQLQSIGIAHRDIKPENIMIDEKIECVKVIDIGEAQESSVGKDEYLECVGSPYYMAPEILILKTNESIKI